jgi:hypothetical protein
MPDEEIPTDGNEEVPVDEAELLSHTVEQLLSECEAAAPRVYVLEMMSLTKKARRRAGISKTINPQFNYSMYLILALVKKVAQTVWRGPETVENGIRYREVAVVAGRGAIETLGLGGECMRLREIEVDELFETEESMLLLQPRQVREIASDFVFDALQTRLTDNWHDARLAVLQAAAECLLEHLDEDMRLIPDSFSLVIEAIDEVLSTTDWFHLTKDRVLSLSDEVMRRVANT